MKLCQVEAEFHHRIGLINECPLLQCIDLGETLARPIRSKNVRQNLRSTFQNAPKIHHRGSLRQVFTPLRVFSLFFFHSPLLLQSEVFTRHVPLTVFIHCCLSFCSFSDHLYSLCFCVLIFTLSPPVSFTSMSHARSTKGVEVSSSRGTSAGVEATRRRQRPLQDLNLRCSASTR